MWPIREGSQTYGEWKKSKGFICHDQQLNSWRLKKILKTSLSSQGREDTGYLVSNQQRWILLT